MLPRLPLKEIRQPLSSSNVQMGSSSQQSHAFATQEKEIRTEDSFRNKRILKMENDLKAYASVNQEVIVQNAALTKTHHTQSHQLKALRQKCESLQVLAKIERDQKSAGANELKQMRERLEHCESELQQAHEFEHAQLASERAQEDACARKTELADASTQCDIERDMIESRQREALSELAQQVCGLSAAREELEARAASAETALATARRLAFDAETLHQQELREIRAALHAAQNILTPDEDREGV